MVHIIHISAHGKVNSLWLEDGLGRAHEVSVGDLLQWLGSVKLLLISACSTVELGETIYEHVKHLSTNVIAVQGSMDDKASTTFAQILYQVKHTKCIIGKFGEMTTTFGIFK